MIRKINEDDIDIIMNIWLETNIKSHNFIDEKYWQENYNLVKNQYLPISQTYVFDENGDIKGFISILDNNFIGALFVNLKFQNQGVGTKLIKYCQKIYNQLSLSVYKENTSAIKFYKKNNFKIISENKTSFPEHKEYEMNWKII